MNKKLVSIIIPVFNEEKNISVAYTECSKVMDTLSRRYEYEFVFIDDGSSDNSWIELEKLTIRDQRVKVISFSRNFGKEVALTAGINHCNGDACILFDCDLQYPVELLPQFIKKWKEGNEIVIGIRDKKKEKNYINTLGSLIFTKIMKSISDANMVKGAIDFRLIDRLVINEFNFLSERNRMTRNLIDWLGFRKTFVPYTEKERINGKSTLTFKGRVRLAFDGIVSGSLIPLKIAGYLGTFITLLSAFLVLAMVIEQFVLGDPLELLITGTAYLAVLNLFLTGITLISLGLIAMYIGNIHTEVSNRPLYIVRSKRNL